MNREYYQILRSKYLHEMSFTLTTEEEFYSHDLFFFI